MRDDHVEDRSLVHRIARSIRWSSVPIVLVWLLIAVITNVYVPQLEEVGEGPQRRVELSGCAVAAGDETHGQGVSVSSTQTVRR